MPGVGLGVIVTPEARRCVFLDWIEYNSRFRNRREENPGRWSGEFFYGSMGVPEQPARMGSMWKSESQRRFCDLEIEFSAIWVLCLRGSTHDIPATNTKICVTWPWKRLLPVYEISTCVQYAIRNHVATLFHERKLCPKPLFSPGSRFAVRAQCLGLAWRYLSEPFRVPGKIMGIYFVYRSFV